METSENFTDQNLNQLTSSAEGFRVSLPARPEDNSEQMTTGGCGRNTIASFAQYFRDSSSWRIRQESLIGQSDEFSGTWPKSGLMLSGKPWQREDSTCPTSVSESLSLPGETGSQLYGPMNANCAIAAVSPGAQSAATTTQPADALALALTSRMDGTSLTNRGDLWPTLSRRDYKGTSAASWRVNNTSPDTLPDAIAQDLGLPPEKTVHLSPGFCEQFMGFPEGWTELDPLATQLSPK